MCVCMRAYEGWRTGGYGACAVTARTYTCMRALSHTNTVKFTVSWEAVPWCCRRVAPCRLYIGSSGRWQKGSAFDGPNSAIGSHKSLMSWYREPQVSLMSLHVCNLPPVVPKEKVSCIMQCCDEVAEWWWGIGRPTMSSCSYYGSIS